MSDDTNATPPQEATMKIGASGLPTKYAVFTPTEFKVSDEFAHFTGACASGYILGVPMDGTSPMTKKEFNFVESFFTETAKEAQHFGLDVWAAAGRTHFLVNPRVSGLKKKDNIKEADSEKKVYRALLTTYEGRGHPHRHESFIAYDKTMHTLRKSVADCPGFCSQWKRFNLPDDHPTKLKFRWSRVELFYWDETQYVGLEHRYDVMRKALDADCKDLFRMYGFRVKLQKHMVSFQGLVSRLIDSDSAVGRSVVLDAVHGFLRKEYNADENYVVHGDKFFDARKQNEDPQERDGFRLLQGMAQNFGINCKGEVIIATRHVAKYFLPAKEPVSEFMLNYFKHKDNEESKHDHEKRLLNTGDLNKMLRGKFVVFDDTAKHVVQSFSEQDPGKDARCASDVTEPEKHTQWREQEKRDGSLSKPQVPVLTLKDNLLSQPQYRLCPPEICSFVPMQSCKTGPKPAQSEIDQTISLTIHVEGESARVTEKVVQRSIIKPDTAELDRQFKQVFADQKPNLLFVNIKIDGVDAVVAGDIFTKFRQDVYSHDQIQEFDAQIEPYLLDYLSHDKVKSQQNWSSQLSEYVSTHRSDQRCNFLIVALPAGEHSDCIYQILKAICDTKIGIQSFFVGAGTLSQYQGSPSGGPTSKSPAGNILHRMRLRNVKMFSLDNPVGYLKLAVAIHVGRVNRDLFLFAVVARNMLEAKDYYADVKLIKCDDELFKYPMIAVEKLMKNVKHDDSGHKTHNVMVFRSGIMSPYEADGKEVLPYSKQFVPGTFYVEDRKIDGKSAESTMSDSATAEYADLVKRLASNPPKVKINSYQSHKALSTIESSYVLLRDHGSAHVPLPTAPESGATQTTTGRRARMVFARTSALHNDESAIGSLHPTGPETPQRLVTLNLIGREPAPSKKRHELVRPESTFLDFSEESLKDLANIYYDDHLGIYNSKWPIPTYLARSALARARCHLQLNGDSTPGAAKYILPPVHAGVRDTLYYI